MERALKDAKLELNQLEEVILVGGSTRIPAVIDLVKKIAGKEPNVSVNPDEVVALGAAVQGGVLAGEVCPSPARPPARLGILPSFVCCELCLF